MTEYRVCHDREVGSLWRDYLPEVFVLAEYTMPITKAWQELTMAMNPGLTGKRYRDLYGDDKALTNRTGYGPPSNKPRADFINHIEEDAPLPLFDKVRVCGGAILHGKLTLGKILTVETLNGNLPPPPVEWIMARPWLYFEALTVRADGTNGRFPQNPGHPIYIPLAATRPVRVIINRRKPGKPIPYIKVVR